MISLCLKKILLFVSVFFMSFYFAGADTLKANKACIERLVKEKKYLVEQKGSPPVLSVKGQCEEQKAEAAKCCSSPNSCSGFLMDIAKNAGPLLPSLYSAYKGYKTSEKASSGELSHEEAVAKMCDAQNKAAMGGFASGLFSQLGTLLETTCKDKIKQCARQCNNRLTAFRQDFKACFAHIAPNNKGVGDIIHFAKQCVDIEDVTEEEVNTLKEAKEYDKTCLIDVSKGEIVGDGGASLGCEEVTRHIISQYADIDTAYKEFEKNKQNMKCIEGSTIGHILLFARAYKNSSVVKEFEKMGDLSEQSGEKDIVNCSKQKNRVATRRKGPRAPVSAPVVQLCRQIAGSFDGNPSSPLPPPSMLANQPGSANNTGSFTGQLPGTQGKQFPDWMYPTDDDGIQDDLPDPKNAPPLAQLSKSSGSSSPGGSGGGSGGAGGMPGGGLNSSPRRGSGSYSPYSSLAGSYGSFDGGGGGYQNVAGNDKTAAYKQAASKQKETKAEYQKGDGTDNLDQKEGKSIFQIASKRIQMFCSDHSCIE